MLGTEWNPRKNKDFLQVGGVIVYLFFRSSGEIFVSNAGARTGGWMKREGAGRRRKAARASGVVSGARKTFRHKKEKNAVPQKSVRRERGQVKRIGRDVSFTLRGRARKTQMKRGKISFQSTGSREGERCL